MVVTTIDGRNTNNLKVTFLNNVCIERCYIFLSKGGNENSEMLHNRSNKISEMSPTQVFQQRFLAYA